MARILISYYKIQEVPLEKTLVYWDGLANELKEVGNDVFLLNTACLTTYNSNISKNKKALEIVRERIRKFDPEIIITFNHRIPKEILEEYDLPVIIWDGDELKFFCDLDYIKENISRYKVFTIVKDWKKNYFDFGFNEKQVFYIPNATAIKRQEMEQIYNVSFLGMADTHKLKFQHIITSENVNKDFYNIVHSYLNNPNYNYDFYLENNQILKDYNFSDQELYTLFDYRWLVLANVLDLGLELSGDNWEKFMYLAPQLSAAHNPKRIWSLKENSDFYNSSKISLSIHHPQARGQGFSWRCFDVMASNACLVASTSTELNELLRKENLKIPMFDTPYEARELCIKLLNDDVLRNEIVCRSQEFVEKNARWIERFKQIESILNTKLVYEDRVGILINNYDLYNIQNKEKRRNIKLKDKIRYKVWKHLNKKLQRKGLI